MVVLRMKHKFFQKEPVGKFQVRIENSYITMESQRDLFFIGIEENIDCKVEELISDILSILFIYLGGYPEILKMTREGQVVDISEIVEKYNTASNFRRSHLSICQINKTTINQGVLDNYRKINQMPVFSLQYLVSANYQYVLYDHKITLLFHIIDGIIPDSEMKNNKIQIKNRYGNNGEIGKYMSKVFCLVENYFFKYDRKYSLEILNRLNISEFDFLKIISDTRNWYSHFLSIYKKKDRLQRGDEMAIYFELTYYMIRLRLLDVLNIKIDSGRITEYFYSIHDWILNVKNIKGIPYKSGTYKRSEALDDLKKAIERCSTQKDM